MAFFSLSPSSPLYKALLGTATAILFLLMTEGLLRLLDIPAQGLYRGDPATSWILRPNLDVQHSGPPQPFRIQSNALGMRVSAPQQQKYWLAVGCSTTFGWGVEAAQAWPAQLSKLQNIQILNGGQPGWSTHQAVQGLGEWQHLQPQKILVSYIVRDAQLAVRADRDAVPSLWFSSLQLIRILKPRRSKSATGTISRVSPADFRRNLRQLQQFFPDAEFVYFAFPQIEPSREWVDIIHEFPHITIPRFQATEFFANDPIHLHAKGHQQLAKAISASLAEQATSQPP